MLRSIPEIPFVAVFPYPTHDLPAHVAFLDCNVGPGGAVPMLLFPAHTYSHSMVAGGFPEMSYTTREMPRSSLMMRKLTRSRNSYGRCAQRAVMKSIVCTARNAITHS